MSQYNRLAGVYDGLTADVPYGAFAGFYERVFAHLSAAPHTVLDLACGTGTLTEIMASRGYEMIGVDSSEEMLSVALEKTLSCPVRPLLLCQKLEELDLYGTVEAAVSSLDGFNYIPAETLPEVFRRLHLFIEPGGILVFDILRPDALAQLDGQMFIDENEDAYCVWRAEFDTETCACNYGIDVFIRDGDRWERSFEEHVEYAHQVDAVTRMLTEAGFTDIETFGAGGSSDIAPPEDGGRRIFISARRSREA